MYTFQKYIEWKRTTDPKTSEWSVLQSEGVPAGGAKTPLIYFPCSCFWKIWFFPLCQAS